MVLVNQTDKWVIDTHRETISEIDRVAIELLAIGITDNVEFWSLQTQSDGKEYATDLLAEIENGQIEYTTL